MLNGAGIPTIGPVFTWFGEQRPQQVRVGYQMLAVLDADNAEEAEAHVRDNLPDGDYDDVGPAEPWDGCASSASPAHSA